MLELTMSSWSASWTSAVRTRATRHCGATGGVCNDSLRSFGENPRSKQASACAAAPPDNTPQADGQCLAIRRIDDPRCTSSMQVPERWLCRGGLQPFLRGSWTPQLLRPLRFAVVGCTAYSDVLAEHHEVPSTGGRESLKMEPTNESEGLAQATNFCCQRHRSREYQRIVVPGLAEHP